jgi:hypothetical protein
MARREWTQPRVSRLQSGSAEEGADPSPDSGAFPS